ncbi:MAG: PAS domain-containing protein [Bacteroidales bacterium]|nr:PAS domain-containing protein [Bacteroidales bacterium]
MLDILLHYTACIVFILLTVIVLRRKTEISILKYLFAFALFNFAVWSFGFLTIKIQLFDIQLTNYILKYSSFYYGFAGTSIIGAILMYVGYRRKAVYIALLLYSLIGTYFFITGYQFRDFEALQNNVASPFLGMINSYPQVIRFFQIGNNILLSGSAVILGIMTFREKSVYRKKQYRIFLITSLISYALVVWSIYIVKKWVYPDFYMLVLGLSMYYNILNHNFLILSPINIGRELFDYSAVGIIITDENRKITAINKRMKRLLGANADIYDLKAFGEKYLAQMDDEFETDYFQFRTQIKTTQPTEITDVFYYRNRILKRNIPYGEVVYIQDISQLARAENQLSEINRNLEEIVKSRTVELREALVKMTESENLFKSLSKLNPHSVLIVENGQIVFCNQAASQMFDADEDRFITNEINGLVKIQEPVQFANDEFLAALPSINGQEVKIKTPNNHQIWVLANALQINYYQRSATMLSLIDISTQKRNQIQLEKSKSRIRKLAMDIQSTKEKEQGNLAKDIHDNIGQSLSVLKILCSRLEKKIFPENVEARILISESEATLNEVITKIKNISRSLNPEIIDKLGLSGSIEWLCFNIKRKTTINVKFEDKTKSLEYSKSDSLHIFRIVQESISNVIKHSEAKNMIVKISESSSKTEFMVKDDGKGFEANIENSVGMGLINMENRAKSIGADFRIDSSESGTTVLVCLNKASKI